MEMSETRARAQPGPDEHRALDESPLMRSCCKIRERVVVQDIGNGITHCTHHMLHRALGMFRIGAVAAFLVGRLAQHIRWERGGHPKCESLDQG